MTEQQADDYVKQHYKFDEWNAVHAGRAYDISIKEFNDIFWKTDGAFWPITFDEANHLLTNVSGTPWDSNNQMKVNSTVASYLQDIKQVGTYTIKSNTDQVLNVESITNTIDFMYSDTF